MLCQQLSYVSVKRPRLGDCGSEVTERGRDMARPHPLGLIFGATSPLQQSVKPTVGSWPPTDLLPAPGPITQSQGAASDPEWTSRHTAAQRASPGGFAADESRL